MPEDKNNNRLAQRLAKLERAVAALKADAACSPVPESHRYVSFSAFAEALGFSRTWPYGLVESGELRSVKIVGRPRIRFSDAVKWIEDNTE